MADLTQAAKSTVYGRVQALEELGLVRHVADAAATLRLTDRGELAVKGYFLTYKKGGGVELGKGEKIGVLNINSVTAATTGTRA